MIANRSVPGLDRARQLLCGDFGQEKSDAELVAAEKPRKLFSESRPSFLDASRQSEQLCAWFRNTV